MKGFTFIEMMIVITIVVSRFGYSQDSLELDLDAMWDQAIWEEVEDVTTEVFEVEYVTAVAGVRGAEAEDEALHHLYYRKSMKGPSKMELMEAYGKLRNKVDRLKDIDKLHARLDKHIQTEINYHQAIRDKATSEHSNIHKRIGQVERWIWIFFGGITVIGALLGKASFSSIFN